MMVKRDLKADLELCKQYQDNIGPWISEDGFPTKHLIEVAVFLNQAREGWPHAIERALKAEALAGKLLDVLGRVIPRYLVGRLELDLDSVLEANGLLKKSQGGAGDEAR
jgi:hypothetical protein